MGGEANIETSTWRLVELGRVVLFNQGEFVGKLAVIVEIVDHKRVLIDNPTPSPASTSKNPIPNVPRHTAPLSTLTLTPLVIPRVPRALGTGPLLKRWRAEKLDDKWAESAWARSRARGERRKGLSDFERFKVMRLKKVERFEERKALAKVRAQAANA